jgi:hypothetical protein
VFSQWEYGYSARKQYVVVVCVLSRHMRFTLEVCRVVTVTLSRHRRRQILIEVLNARCWLVVIPKWSKSVFGQCSAVFIIVPRRESRYPDGVWFCKLETRHKWPCDGDYQTEYALDVSGLFLTISRRMDLDNCYSPGHSLSLTTTIVISTRKLQEVVCIIYDHHHDQVKMSSYHWIKLQTSLDVFR